MFEVCSACYADSLDCPGDVVLVAGGVFFVSALVWASPEGDDGCWLPAFFAVETVVVFDDHGVPVWVFRGRFLGGGFADT